MDKIFKNLLYLTLSGFLVAIVAFTALGKFSFDSLTVYTQDQGEEMRTVSVQGEGSIFVKPDIASVNLTVETEGKTVNKVSEENNDKMKNIVAAIKKIGVDEKDIKTTNYNLRPRYDYESRPARIDGYTLSQNITVKIRNLSKVEDVIAEATNSGANRMDSLNFMIDEEDEYLIEARELAVKEAKDKAAEIEDTVGITLGDIIGYRELSNNSAQPIYYEKAMYADSVMGGGMRGEDMAIESGSQEIVSRIELIYEIR